MKQTLLFLFISIFCVLIFSCDSITPKKFEFYYYPSRNVYYDVGNARYLYSLDAGESWDTLYSKNKTEPATLGEKHIIYSTNIDICADNAQHIQQYNGKAVSIATDSSNTQSSTVADRKIKKPKSITTNAEKKEKKPGFFKRLFGKKNK